MHIGTQGGGAAVQIGSMGGTQTGGDRGGQQTGTGAEGGGHVPGQHPGGGDGQQGPQEGAQGPQGMYGLQTGKQGFGKGSYISITGPIQLFTHGWHGGQQEPQGGQEVDLSSILFTKSFSFVNKDFLALLFSGQTNTIVKSALQNFLF